MRTFSKKTYVVTSPSLSQVALRHKGLSMDPMFFPIGVPMLGIGKSTADRMKVLDDDGYCVGLAVVPDRKLDFNRRMAPGTDLTALSAAATAEIASIVNKIGTGWATEDLYMWLRDTVTYATAVGLYGKHCPLIEDRSLIEDIW